MPVRAWNNVSLVTREQCENNLDIINTSFAEKLQSKVIDFLS